MALISGSIARVAAGRVRERVRNAKRAAKRIRIGEKPV